MNAPLKLAIGGLGAIGMAVARKVDAGGIPDIVLTAVSARDLEKARARIAGLKSPPMLVTLDALADHADVVLEGLKQTGWTCGLTELEPGEKTKSIQHLSKVWDDLLALPADRRTVVIAASPKFEKLGETRRPVFLEAHEIAFANILVCAGKGKLVSLKRHDKIFDAIRFLRLQRDAHLAERPRFTVGLDGRNEQNTERVLFNSLRNVVPELLAAQQFGNITPDLVASIRKLGRQPTRKAVILGRGMADK